jgi:hypothetical protein
MRHTLTSLALGLALCTSTVAHSAGDPLAACLSQHTSAADRQAMARWVFVTMSSHPDLTPYASAQATQDAQRIQGQMAQTLTRLVTENCARETKQALRQGGPASIQSAFTTVARQALTELMSHPNVTAQLSGTVAQIDPSRWARLLLTP